jgi:hypothetical protein
MLVIWLLTWKGRGDYPFSLARGEGWDEEFSFNTRYYFQRE